MKVTGVLLTEVRDNRQVDKIDNLHITKKLRQNKAEKFLYKVLYRFVLVKLRILIASCIEKKVCLKCQISFSWIKRVDFVFHKKFLLH